MTDLIYANRVHEACSGSGLSSLTLLGALSGKATFTSKIATGKVVPYVLLDGNGVDWEVGFGTLSSASELQRTTVKDSSATSGRVNSETPGTPTKISLTTNQHEVFIAPFDKTVLSRDTDGAIADPSAIRAALFVETLADMTALAGLEDGESIIVKGGASLNDGAGGIFYWDASDAGAESPPDTYEHDTEATGLFKRLRFDVQDATAPYVLANIDALQAETWSAAAAPDIVILGYCHVAGDGGGMFRYDSSDTTSSDNNGTIILTSTSGTALRYKRMIDGRNVPSIRNWGAAVTDGVTDTTAAFTAANAATASWPRASVPVGRYATSFTNPLTDLANIVLEGPGQVEINGYAQAPWRSIVRTELTAPASQDRYQVFDQGFPKSNRAAFMGVYTTTPTGTPGATYKNFPQLAFDFVVYDFTAGYNTDASDHSLGRSGVFVHLDRVYHGGQGDLVAYSFYAEVYSKRSSATHFLANPAIAFHNASFGISSSGGEGAYLQGSEYLYSDGGYYCAVVDRVRNFVRENNATTLGVVWGVDRIQTGGTYALDFIMSIQAKLKRGIDFTPCLDMGTDKALVVFPSTGRLYLDGSATADGAGIKWNASSVGGVYIVSTSSDFRIGVGGSDEIILTASALAPAANDGNALGTATLSWADLYGASGFTLNLANSDWVATHSTGVLTVGTGDLRVTTAGTNSASVVTVGGSQTLTSKIYASPVFTGNISHQSGSAFSPQYVLQNNTNDANASYFIFRKSRGGSGTAVQIGDALGNFQFTGYDSAGTPAVQTGAYISAQVATVASGSIVARFQFFSGSKLMEWDGDANRLNLASGTVYAINGTQVVGARDTGWTAMTGTANENTAYDTTTVLLPQLAGRVMAIQAALTAHGLIGT